MRTTTLLLTLGAIVSVDAFRATHVVAGSRAMSVARGASRALSPLCGATAQPETKTRTKQKTSSGSPGGGGGGAPKAAAAKPKRKTHVEDVPLYKVILLSDTEYEQDAVCSVLSSVIPEIENDRQALERYEEAMKTGRSLLQTVPQEQAEFYVEQLARADPQMIVYSTMEEE